MKKIRLLILPFILLLFPASWALSGADILLNEEFRDLSRWKEVYFPKIPVHTKYTVVHEADRSYLRAESNASASLLLYKEPFNPYEFSKVKWRWKTDNILPKADLHTKAGDDVPIRIYIAFAYDPAKAGRWMRLQYNAARLLYGEYPPHSSLNYIWSSREYEEKIITSAYTDRSRMIILEQGEKNVGSWVEEEVNILADYRRIFGEDPPAKATIGIMNDSDNTGGKAVSYISSISVYR